MMSERFWGRVDRRGGDECWAWLAGKHSNGYGSFHGDGGTSRLAHRASYELLVGPIPVGLQLDHLCRNRACVNPSHLEPVTQAENIRRGNSPGAIAKRTGRCKRGHDLEPQNLTVYSKGRSCAICQETRRLERQAERRILRKRERENR